MASTIIPPGPAVHGATVLGARPDDHPRHRLGDALRAVRVFAGAVVEVVVLGNEGKLLTRQDDPGQISSSAPVRRSSASTIR
ncbi:hypothetical protein NMG29_04705 [Streptomyces cocklensis]|jgi:hypothetical protein|uniref:hypothetical protein n=1 Tax=Actinacidiphila cocklensis TaxID=887465 RepID=UPI002040AAAF|nr:hypothetical protein [Actinacidiphila cocklensis]MDD1057529.1 hypothetical protein [Actinacidiphila cocklensis]WSX78950.1 hypothetical protein OH826_36920 [Streptomyces sp. NBC_00899]